MSLTKLAQEKNDADREAARTRAREERDRRDKKALEAIESKMRAYNEHERRPEYAELEVTLIDRKRVERPSRVSDRWGGETTSWRAYTVRRYRIDDVIVRVWDRSGTGDWTLSVEVPCRECGEKTSPEEASEMSGYQSYLVDLVAEAAKQRWTCANCALNIPRQCPECGRGNPSAL